MVQPRGREIVIKEDVQGATAQLEVEPLVRSDQLLSLLLS